MFTPRKDAPQPQLSKPNNYVVYGWQRSYFTHKLMAALHFYGADWCYQDKTVANREELQFRSGTHQIPVLHTPENWMIADTTPLMRMLDGRFPGREMFPAGARGFLVHLLEEYFDEWIARTTVHWRWNYEENHALLSMDAAHGDEAAAANMVVWGGKVCRATGVSSEIQQREAENEYHRIMAAAEEQLSHSAFLLGERPTAVDCIVLAGLRAHFLYDPAPRRELEDRYPAVVDWVHNKADQWLGQGELADLPEVTTFARLVLSEMSRTYQPFVLANRLAIGKGDKAFVIPMYGEDVSYLARPYVEQSRQMLVEHFERLQLTGDAEAIAALLQQYELETVVTK